MATGRLRLVGRLRGWRPGHERARANSSALYEIMSSPTLQGAGGWRG